MRREEKILIVEDNPLIAAAIEKAGERLNLIAEVATDGWDAIEKLRTGDYAAIVIDTDLPRHSGYGVVTYLKQENGEELGNVVLMTTSDPASVRERTSEHLRVIDTTDVDAIARALGRDPENE
jgi:two-component system, sensor histidine kinase and response regulator